MCVEADACVSPRLVFHYLSQFQNFSLYNVCSSTHSDHYFAIVNFRFASLKSVGLIFLQFSISPFLMPLMKFIAELIISMNID